MAADSSSILSHPEILPVEKLKDILSCRGIPGKDLVDKDKHDLVQLFYRFIVPQPQRTSHMRRANRLKTMKRNIRPAGTKERESSSRGIKRKSNSSEMDKTLPKKEDSNFLHDSNQCSSSSPTTDCANRITKLNMNSQVSKPLKLNRECLLHDYKQNNSVSKSKILNCTSRQSIISERTNNECSKMSNKNNSQSNKEEEKQHTAKKFKRITVTWP